MSENQQQPETRIVIYDISHINAATRFRSGGTFDYYCYKLLLLHPFNALYSRTTWVSRRQKGIPLWILLEQEIMCDSGISWTICKSFASRPSQITMPVPHHSVFLQAGCPSCHPTNSVKALLLENQLLLLTTIPCAVGLPAHPVWSLHQQRNVLTIHADRLCSRKPRTAQSTYSVFYMHNM